MKDMEIRCAEATTASEGEAVGGEAEGQLEELIVNYGHVIRGAVRRAGGARLGILSEDVEQSVLLEVWKQVRKRHEIEFPVAYLYRAAIRETVRLMKRVNLRPEESLGRERDATQWPRTAARQEVALEVREAIDSGLGGLNSERRRAVEAHLAGYTVDEIMGRFDWTYSRARNLVARGMADLRQRLRGQGMTP